MKEDKKSEKEKAFLDREISSVEPLVESYTQYHIMLYLYFSSPRCFGVGNSGTAQAIYFYVKLIMSAIGFLFGGINFNTFGPLALHWDIKRNAQSFFSKSKWLSIMAFTIAHIFTSFILPIHIYLIRGRYSSIDS